MEDGAGPTFLFREEWAERTGEESRDGAVAARASRRSRPCHTRPCNEIAMVSGIGPFGAGIVADAEFDQFRLWQRTATPVGTSGRMSISLPHRQRANELASTKDMLAGFADRSAMGQGSVAAGTRLSLCQAGDVPLLPPACANVVGKGWAKSFTRLGRSQIEKVVVLQGIRPRPAHLGGAWCWSAATS